MSIRYCVNFIDDILTIPIISASFQSSSTRIMAMTSLNVMTLDCIRSPNIFISRGPVVKSSATDYWYIIISTDSLIQSIFTYSLEESKNLVGLSVNRRTYHTYTLLYESYWTCAEKYPCSLYRIFIAYFCVSGTPFCGTLMQVTIILEPVWYSSYSESIGEIPLYTTSIARYDVPFKWNPVSHIDG